MENVKTMMKTSCELIIVMAVEDRLGANVKRKSKCKYTFDESFIHMPIVIYTVKLFQILRYLIQYRPCNITDVLILPIYVHG